MKNDIYEQLIYELDEEKRLIDKKKILLGYLWNELKEPECKESTKEKILSSMVSIGLEDKQSKVEAYSRFIFHYIEMTKQGGDLK